MSCFKTSPMDTNMCDGQLKHKGSMLYCLGAVSLNMNSFVMGLLNQNNCRLIVS